MSHGMNSRALTGPAPTGFCYLLRNPGNKKQRGLVSNSRGGRLEQSMYTDPLNSMLMDAWAGGRFCFKKTEGPMVSCPHHLLSISSGAPLPAAVVFNPQQ